MSFFLPGTLHSFHVKCCTFRVFWLVSGTLVKKRNRKRFQNPANILIARTSLTCLYKSRCTTNGHLSALPQTSQCDDLETFLLRWMVPFLPNSARSLNNFWEPNANSTAFLLGKVWWPCSRAEIVDPSTLLNR